MPDKIIRSEVIEIWTDTDASRDDIDRFMRTLRMLRSRFKDTDRINMTPDHEGKLLRALKEELVVTVTFKS